MAGKGKLKDDEIKWVLTVDAKGAQAEIQQLTSSSVQLAEANKRMKAELKASNSQLKEAEKELQKLDKAGKSGSERYAELEATIESVKSDITDYNQKIAQNTVQMRENDKGVQQVIYSMKLEEMTMTQLKSRARDLQTQLDNTAESTSPEAYKQLQGELSAVKERMGAVSTANSGLTDQLSALPGAAGYAVKSIQGVGVALKALIANPVGAFIMAIVVAFQLLKTAIEGSDSASTKLQGALNAMWSVFDSLKRIVTEYYSALYNLITMDFSAFKQNAENIGQISSNLIDNAKSAYDAAIAEDALNDEIARNNDLTEVNKARISELRQVTQDSTKSIEERKKASDELLKLEKDNYKMAVSNISGQYKVWRDQNNNLIDAMRTGSNKQFQEVERYMKLVQEGTELTYKQRIELAKLVNDITTTLDKGTEEEKEKFRSFFSGLSSMQEEYFTGSRRDQRRAIQLEQESARERQQKAKEALEKRLKNEENALNEGVNLLKKKRLDGVLTEKEYNDEVDELTLKNTQKRLRIKGQEKDQIIQYNQQILDLQLKQQETADRELLTTLQKEKDRELRLIDVARNQQLEILQEREKDQAIYTLRAAEIESQSAQARLAVVKQFSTTLVEADFSNNQTRLLAIEENANEILSADENFLKQREKLNKQFAKTTADFERQYNIKNWEQSRQDELAILQKQHEEIKFSEETYQLAKTAIEKKYADEKLKIRMQYGVASMSELYNAEMDHLGKLHENGLLSEEEYEKAKFKVKMEYGQKYAAQAAEWAAMASNTVSALMEAETASVEAEYDARIQAAGDNAEEVERLEKEKAQKKLDIEKKYADVQFAVTVAEIISNTALAIMQAYAQLGPIAGSIAAALMGITGAAQIAVANSQRQKVKQMTLDSSSSQQSAKSGEIRLKEGFSEGGANMKQENDFASGGYTGDGGRYEVAGTVPIHHGEYVVAVPELKHPDVAEKVRSIERIRRKRTDKNLLPEGFSEGGYNMSSGSSDTESKSTREMYGKILQLLDGLISGDIPIKTFYGVTEYQAAEKEKLEAESNFKIIS